MIVGCKNIFSRIFGKGIPSISWQDKYVKDRIDEGYIPIADVTDFYNIRSGITGTRTFGMGTEYDTVATRGSAAAQKYVIIDHLDFGFSYADKLKAWDAATTYKRHDYVKHSGNIYISIAANSNTTPSGDVYPWRLLATEATFIDGWETMFFGQTTSGPVLDGAYYTIRNLKGRFIRLYSDTNQELRNFVFIRGEVTSAGISALFHQSSAQGEKTMENIYVSGTACSTRSVASLVTYNMLLGNIRNLIASGIVLSTVNIGGAVWRSDSGNITNNCMCNSISYVYNPDKYATSGDGVNISNCVMDRNIMPTEGDVNWQKLTTTELLVDNMAVMSDDWITNTHMRYPKLKNICKAYPDFQGFYPPVFGVSLDDTGKATWYEPALKPKGYYVYLLIKKTVDGVIVPEIRKVTSTPLDALEYTIIPDGFDNVGVCIRAVYERVVKLRDNSKITIEIETPPSGITFVS